MKEKFLELRKTHNHELMLFGILILLVVVMSAISPGRFFTFSNIQSMALQMSEFGFFALGMMAIIITGGINLAIVAQAAIASIIGASILTQPFATENPMLYVPIAIIAMVLVGIITGIGGGFFVAYVGATPILVTLGFMSLLNGLSLVLTKGSPISGFPAAYKLIGSGNVGPFPIPFLLFVLGAMACYLLLERSAFGTRLYMVGCNERATLFSAVNTKHVLMQAYILCGIMAAFAGIIMSSRYNSAKMDYGASYQMQSIAAAVLGGTRISGGQGTVVGTVLAVCIIQVISNGLNIVGVNRYGVDIINGVFLVVVLTIGHFMQRGRHAVADA